METYFGRRAEKYLLAQQLLAEPPRKIYWNWAAAILGPVWLFYRKLYRWLILWLAIGVPFDFLYFAAPRLDPNLSHPLMALLVKFYIPLSLLYILATNLLLGCWGTYLYIKHSERLVELFKSKAPVSIAVALLAEKGNPSRWRIAAGIVLIAAIYLGTYWLTGLWAANNLHI